MLSAPWIMLALLLVPSVAMGQTRAAGDREDIRGDGFGERISVLPAAVSLEASPVHRLDVVSNDGSKLRLAYRAPAGAGPHPAILMLHGGMGQNGPAVLAEKLRQNPTYTRFLARGYVVVAGDHRNYRRQLQDRQPVEDVLATLDAIEELPAVDAGRIAVFGGSAGGYLALEVAGETSLAAVVAAEPASVIYAGLLTDYKQPDKPRILRRPLDFYTPELRRRTRAKLERIAAPLLIVQSDQSFLKFVNRQLLVPELAAVGKPVEVLDYPGHPHGFYWGHRTDSATLERLVEDVDAFVRRAFADTATNRPG